MLLRRRLVFLFAGNLVLILVLGAIGLVIINDRDRTRTVARRLGVAQEQVAQLATAYSDEETGTRGFALGGDERFLEPFNNGSAAAARLVSSLRAVSDDEHALRSPLSAVTAAAQRWMRVAAQPAIAQRRAGNAAEAGAILTDQGKAAFDSLRRAEGRLAARVADESNAADGRADTARSRLSLVLLSLFAVALAGVLVASWCVRRWVTRPLGALSEQVRRSRAGAAVATIRVDDPPEITTLAADVDAMRSRIEAQRAAAEHSRTALEESAAVLLTVRAYLEPEVGPLPQGWTIAAELRAAAGVVAGDCYDIVSLHDDHLGVLVVDIAGHGAAEGILALRCKELLRGGLATSMDPGIALTTAAQQLGEMDEEVFLTAFVAIIDTTRGAVRYANAGHPPAFVAAPDGVIELGPTGPLIGFADSDWPSADAQMSPGDTLCVYTDGLIEARDEGNGFYGPERLMSLIQGSRCDEAAAVVKRSIDEVQAFSAGGLRDDVTIVVVCRSGP